MSFNYDRFYDWYLRHAVLLHGNQQFKVFFYKLDRSGVSNFILQDDTVCNAVRICNKTVYLSFNRQKKEVYFVQPKRVGTMIYSDHYTFGKKRWLGKNRVLNMSGFDYVYFHKTIQDTTQHKASHVHSWFLDNYQLQDTSINSTNSMSCFYKNDIFSLQDAKDENNTVAFSQSDLSTINEIMTSPINSRYIGGSNKNSIQVDKFVDISTIKNIFKNNQECNEISICVIVDKTLAHVNIIFDNEFIYKNVNVA